LRYILIFLVCFEFIYLCMLFAYDKEIIETLLGEQNTYL